MREKKHKIIAECNSLYIETRQFCIFSEDGVAVAQIRMDIPAATSKGIVAEYLRKLSQAQEEYVNISLDARVKEDYAADSDLGKRFCFKKYRYTSKIDITYQDDMYISVLAEAKLTRGGEVLSVKRKGVIFTAVGIVPPIEFGVRKLQADEVLVLNSDAVPCLRKYGFGDIYEEFAVKNKKSV
jgi:hypothetical protein